MSRPTDEIKPDETQAPPADAPPAEEEVEETDPVEDEDLESEDDEQDDNALSVEDYQQATKKARREAANYRTRLRAVEEQLANVESLEEVQTLLTKVRQESADAARALVVENVALKFNLPDDLASALQGSTREELEAHAKKLAKYAPAPTVEPSDLQGGLDPDSTDTGTADPVALAKRALRKGY